MTEFKVGDCVRLVRPPKNKHQCWASEGASYLGQGGEIRWAPELADGFYRLDFFNHPGSMMVTADMIEHFNRLDPLDPPEAGAAEFDRARLVVPAPPPNSATQVFIYEREFYPLSNFSAFSIQWRGLRFDTSEHAYHWEKFPGHEGARLAIQSAISAHEAFKLAEQLDLHRRADWGNFRTTIMEAILRAKASQHEYVRRKLLETGCREIVEDSWRDDFWGWGPGRQGRNMLGILWMKIRADLRPG